MNKPQSRAITRRAIQAGTLVRQPCEVCGNPDVDAHHTDYEQPLLVQWLCRQHHMETHGWTWWTPEKIAASAAWWESMKAPQPPEDFA